VCDVEWRVEQRVSLGHLARFVPAIWALSKARASFAAAQTGPFRAKRVCGQVATGIHDWDGVWRGFWAMLQHTPLGEGADLFVDTIEGKSAVLICRPGLVRLLGLMGWDYGLTPFPESVSFWPRTCFFICSSSLHMDGQNVTEHGQNVTVSRQKLDSGPLTWLVLGCSAVIHPIWADKTCPWTDKSCPS